MRHERLFLSISTLPWGSVWTVSIQTLTKRDRHSLSALLLTGGWILHGVTAPNPAPRHAAGMAHKLQHVLYLWVSPANAADHQPYTWGHLFSEMWTLYFSWASYYVVIPSLLSISLLTPELSASWLHTYLWSCWSSRDMKSKFRKCVLFCRLLFIYGYCGADVGTLTLFKCIVLFCSVLHCMWHIWNWIYCLITDTVFVLVESRDRE